MQCLKFANSVDVGISPTGRPLWDFQTGAPIAANPISFNIDGHQHVAIAADE
jgi:hypothetical protein